MDFIEDLPIDQVQPWVVELRGDFVAIQQWDGTGEFEHLVLIPRTEAAEFLGKARNALAVSE